MVFSFEVGEHISCVVSNHSTVDKMGFHRSGTITEKHRVRRSASDKKAIRAIGIAGIDISWSKRRIDMRIVERMRWAYVTEYRARSRSERQVRTDDFTSVEI